MEGHLNDTEINVLKEESIQYALSHGVFHGSTLQDSVYFSHMPYSLIPVPMKRQLYAHSLELSRLWDKLCIEICNEKTWLFDSLENCSDTFIQQLLSIARKAVVSPYYQPITASIIRSDYMSQKNSKGEEQLLQIELNTISASSMGVMDGISALHKRLLIKYMNKFESIQQYYHASKYVNIEDHLPINSTVHKTAEGLVVAHRTYPSITGSPSILFVIQNNESNVIDQYNLAYAIEEDFKVNCIFRTIDHLQKTISIENGILYVYMDDTHTIKEEISVVYYRSFYNPSDMTNPETWKLREDLECCLAIKVPNVLLQLVGSKYIQYALSKEGAVEQFLPEKESAYLRQCFASMWSLDEVTIDPTTYPIQDAIQNPDHYLLKPQREGGGHIIAGDTISTMLSNPSQYKENLSGTVLMQKITGKHHLAVHVREGQAKEYDCISELGIISYTVGGGHFYHDSIIGHLLKTKKSWSIEGGVGAGYAVLNTLYLEDN
ncbi:hypothetical protein WA158_005312 [Blastocystis sp. Blastoise]